MSASILSVAQFDRACEVAATIGRSLRTARRARNEKLEATAARCSMNFRTLSLIELGASPNVKLGNIQKLLDHFGLALVVMPKGNATAFERARSAPREN